jgi:3-hydroxyacyl-CoA dehydrogenase
MSQDAKEFGPISYHTQGNVALVGLNSAPVNALSKAVRIGVIDSVNEALANDSVSAIVLYSKLPLFSAGADISEFSGGDLSPMLPEVLEIIEQASKPVVAAVTGNALGASIGLPLQGDT